MYSSLMDSNEAHKGNTVMFVWIAFIFNSLFQNLKKYTLLKVKSRPDATCILRLGKSLSEIFLSILH